MDNSPTAGVIGGHHAPNAGEADETTVDEPADTDDGWTPPVLQTVATTGVGVDELRGALDGHREHLVDSGERETRRQTRAETEIRRLLRSDLAGLAERAAERRGGIDALAAAAARGESDPYQIVDELLEPLEASFESSTAEKLPDGE